MSLVPLHSLRSQISRMVLAGLVFLTLAILTVVWVTTLNAAREEMAQRSGAARAVLERIITNTNKQIFRSAKVLTADSSFKNALIAQDVNALQNVLLNHKESIGAEALIIVGLDGIITASSVPQFVVGTSFTQTQLMHAALHNEGGYAFYQVDGRLLSLIATPVLGPSIMAVAVVGVEINQGFVRHLSELVGRDLQISAVSMGDDSLESTLVVSSLPVLQAQQAIFVSPSQLNLKAALLAGDNGYVADTNRVYDQPKLDVSLTLLTPIQAVFADDLDLLQNIAWLSFLAVMVSFGISSLVARQLASPLGKLVASLEAIAAGEYQNFDIQSSKIMEIDRLAVAFRMMQGQVQEREQRIAYQVDHDALTDFYNRKRLVEVLTGYLKAEKTTPLIQLKVMDLRHIFDIFGYQSGELLIKAVAQRLKAMGGHFARLSGAEFVWLPSFASRFAMPNQEALVALHEMMSSAYDIDQQLIRPEFAIASLVFPTDAASPSAALMRLNIACDTAYGLPSRVRIYTNQLEQEYRYRLAILGALKIAVATDTPGFTLDFQPKFRLSTLQPERAEALLRWQHPELGQIPPEVFVAVAEQADLMPPITRWVIDQVIRQQFVWRENNVIIQVAINLSAQDLENKNLLPFISQALKRYGLAPDVISFEVTESALMSDPADALKSLRAFQKYGFSLSIDDFGTGYSSLAYLKSMPVDELKIDKAFVLRLDQDENDQTIVETVLSLAKRFHLEVVAEGVESLETLELLRSWECEWVQGFYLSHPMPQEAFGPWFQAYTNEALMRILHNKVNLPRH